MKKVALIVAAGKGSRMNRTTPKQFLLLKHKPVLYYTLKAFMDAYHDVEIILVLPPEHIAHGQEIIDGFFGPSNLRICEGGRTRFHSVQNGLKLIDKECIVFVHDGVRCLITPSLIRHAYEEALQHGNAIPAVPCKDSLRLIAKDTNNGLDRNTVRLIQTPQTFHSKLLIPAFQIDYKEHFTDEAAVMEAFGLNIHLVEGDPDNLKITTETDLFLAEKILEVREQKELQCISDESEM